MKQLIEISIKIDLMQLKQLIQSGEQNLSVEIPTHITVGSSKPKFEELVEKAAHQYLGGRKNITALYKEMDIEQIVGWSLRQFSRNVKKHINQLP